MTHLQGLKARFYAFSFLDDFTPIYPLYAVMFTDTGLNAAQVASLLFAWSLTSFLLEVPSGAVADRFSRKHVLMGAQLARAAGYALWLFVPNYWGFLAGFILWGIKSAFTSGTQQALVFDELKAVGQENIYTKLRGRLVSAEMVGNMLSSLLAVVLVPFGYSWLLAVSVLSGLVNVVVIATLPGVKRAESTEETKYWEYLKEGVVYAFRHPRILNIILLTGFVLGFGALDEYYGLFFKQIGLGNQAISFWHFAGLAVGMVAGLVAHRFAENQHFSQGKSIAIMLAVWGAVLLGASMTSGILAPLGIVAFGFFFYLIQTLGDGWLQHGIESKARATVTSVQGMVSELFALASFVLVGGLAQWGGYVFAFQITAVTIIAVGAIFLLFKNLTTSAPAQSRVE